MTIVPVRQGEGEYDPYYREYDTLTEATSKLPSSAKDMLFTFCEETVVMARPLPRLDGWRITAAGDACFAEEAMS